MQNPLREKEERKTYIAAWSEPSGGLHDPNYGSLTDLEKLANLQILLQLLRQAVEPCQVIKRLC